MEPVIRCPLATSMVVRYSSSATVRELHVPTDSLVDGGGQPLESVQETL